MDSRVNRNGQVSIFVIIAIIIVGAIILIFLLFRGIPVLNRGQEFSPESYIDSCIRAAVRENADLMMTQGGFVNPDNYHPYNNIKVTYVCQNINNFEPCVNQYPAFKEQVTRELEKEIGDDLTSCFDALSIELESKGYEYTLGEHRIEIELRPEVVETTVYKEFSFSKNGAETKYTSFKSSTPSPLGKLSEVVGSFLIYEESQHCYAETLGWVLLYGNEEGIDIRKEDSYDSTKVYTIVDTKTGKEMNVATRGCVLAHGFYGN